MRNKTSTERGQISTQRAIDRQSGGNHYKKLKYVSCNGHFKQKLKSVPCNGNYKTKAITYGSCNGHYKQKAEVWFL